LVGEAYTKWHELEEIDGVLNDNIALLTQGIFQLIINDFCSK